MKSGSVQIQGIDVTLIRDGSGWYYQYVFDGYETFAGGYKTREDVLYVAHMSVGAKVRAKEGAALRKARKEARAARKAAKAATI